MNDLKKENISKIFSEFKENNMSSYNNLYEEYYSIVYGIVFTILKNKENAEDVTQEVFIKIYNMKKENLPEKGELSWLYTVSKNEAFQFLRKSKNQVNIEEIYEVKEEKNEIDKIIDINTYNRIISPLNEIEKQIVSLKIISNFSFKKIGQMLSMPTPTVQWRYYKAVNSLKISIANFAAFVVTFSILISRKLFNNKIKQESDEKVYDNKLDEESYNNESLNATKQENDIKTNYSDNNYDNSSLIGTFTNTSPVSEFSATATTSEEMNNINYFDQILVCFSGFFLIISVIFAIFLKKYQQKRIKKASK